MSTEQTIEQIEAWLADTFQGTDTYWGKPKKLRQHAERLLDEVVRPVVAERDEARAELALASAEAEDARDGGMDLVGELAEVRAQLDELLRQRDQWWEHVGREKAAYSDLLRGMARRVGEARASSRAWKTLAERWERDHQGTVLPYTEQIEAERDLALWLHAEAVWQRDEVNAEIRRVLAEVENSPTEEQWNGLVHNHRQVLDAGMELIAQKDLLCWLHAESEWKREQDRASRFRWAEEAAHLTEAFGNATTEWAVRQAGTVEPIRFEDEDTARHMAVAMRYPLRTEVVSRMVTDWCTVGESPARHSDAPGTGPVRGCDLPAGHTPLHDAGDGGPV